MLILNLIKNLWTLLRVLAITKVTYKQGVLKIKVPLIVYLEYTMLYLGDIAYTSAPSTSNISIPTRVKSKA